MATSRPSCVSCARYTSPIPPAPSFATIWYGPRQWPIERPLRPASAPGGGDGWLLDEMLGGLRVVPEAFRSPGEAPRRRRTLRRGTPLAPPSRAPARIHRSAGRRCHRSGVMTPARAYLAQQPYLRQPPVAPHGIARHAAAPPRSRRHSIRRRSASRPPGSCAGRDGQRLECLVERDEVMTRLVARRPAPRPA